MPSISNEQSKIEQGLLNARAQGLTPQELKAGLVADLGYFQVYCRGVDFGVNQSGYQIIFKQASDLVPGAAVLAKLEDRIVMIEVYRHTVQKLVLEIPRGFSEANELPAKTAERELFEETGLRCSQITPIGRLHPNTGYSSECIPLFAVMANGVPRLTGDESIKKIVLISIDDFSNLIANDEIMDSFTLAAYTRARLTGWL